MMDLSRHFYEPQFLEHVYGAGKRGEQWAKEWLKSKEADEQLKKMDTVTHVTKTVDFYEPKQQYRLLMNGITALRNLVRRDADTKLAAVKCNGIMTVVTVMMIFMDRPRLQDMAFAFIMYLGQC